MVLGEFQKDVDQHGGIGASTIDAIISVGDRYLSEGKLDEAQAVWEVLVELFSQLEGLDVSIEVSVRYRMAAGRARVGDHQNAMATFLWIVNSAPRLSSAVHWAVDRSLDDMVASSAALGEADECLEFLRQVRTQFAAMLGTRHQVTLHTEQAIGRLEAAQQSPRRQQPPAAGHRRSWGAGTAARAPEPTTDATEPTVGDAADDRAREYERVRTAAREADAQREREREQQRRISRFERDNEKLERERRDLEKSLKPLQRELSDVSATLRKEYGWSFTVDARQKELAGRVKELERREARTEDRIKRIERDVADNNAQIAKVKSGR
jgi:hypothetical protein